MVRGQLLSGDVREKIAHIPAASLSTHHPRVAFIYMARPALQSCNLADTYTHTSILAQTRTFERRAVSCVAKGVELETSQIVRACSAYCLKGRWAIPRDVYHGTATPSRRWLTCAFKPLRETTAAEPLAILKTCVLQ